MRGKRLEQQNGSTFFNLTMFYKHMCVGIIEVEIIFSHLTHPSRDCLEILVAVKGFSLIMYLSWHVSLASHISDTFETSFSLVRLPGNVTLTLVWVTSCKKVAQGNLISSVTLAIITPYYILAHTHPVMANYTLNLKLPAKLCTASFRFPNWWLDVFIIAACHGWFGVFHWIHGWSD